MEDTIQDQSLFIRTTGIREWNDMETHYNRCESTPYGALDELFKVYKLEEADSVVDFGSGRGRVAFYIHDNFGVPVTGVEVNDITYDEAVKNIMRHTKGKKYENVHIRFEYGIAENYEITPDDNKFYFFNPFSISIFKDVVENILKSVEEHKRSVDIILYYPMPKYKRFLKKKTPFNIINKVSVPGVNDKREKFYIYRLEVDEMKS